MNETKITKDELDVLYNTIALLNSMVYSGELHSETSRGRVINALDLIGELKLSIKTGDKP